MVEGLSSSGFAPTDSEHIGYLVANWDSESHHLKFDSPQEEAREAKGDATLVIPFERFDRQGEKRIGEPNSVVVLWVQEDDCKDAPFTRLAWLSNQLGLAGDGPETQARHIRTTVLGPTTSTLLERMVIEAQRMKDYPESEHDAVVRKELRGVSIFCPTATATGKAFLPPERAKQLNDSSKNYYADWKKFGGDPAKDSGTKNINLQCLRSTTSN